MDKTQYDILLKAIRKMDKKVDLVEESVNRVDRDLADDRKSIDDMKLKLAGVIESNKSIINSVARLHKKISDSVKDAVAESVAPVGEQLGEFVDKKVIRVKVPTDKWTAKILALINKYTRR